MWNFGRKAIHELVHRHRMHHGYKGFSLKTRKDLHNANERGGAENNEEANDICKPEQLQGPSLFLQSEGMSRKGVSQARMRVCVCLCACRYKYVFSMI